MRVLFLSEIDDPGVGSAVRQAYQQARRLRELGHETALVSTVRDRSQSSR